MNFLSMIHPSYIINIQFHCIIIITFQFQSIIHPSSIINTQCYCITIITIQILSMIHHPSLLFMAMDWMIILSIFAQSYRWMDR